MNFGNRIKGLIELNKTTVSDLAKKIGVNRVFLSRIVNNHQIPSFETLGKICNVFGITLSEFFSTEDTILPPEYRELIQNAKALTPKQLKHLNEFLKEIRHG